MIYFYELASIDINSYFVHAAYIRSHDFAMSCIFSFWTVIHFLSVFYVNIIMGTENLGASDIILLLILNLLFFRCGCDIIITVLTTDSAVKVTIPVM